MSDPYGWRLRALAARRSAARGCAAAVLAVAVAVARVAAGLPGRRLPGHQRLCRLLARLARAANPLVPSDATTADVVARTIVETRTALAVVLGTASAAVTTLDVYPLAADQALGPAAVQWLRRHGTADARLAAEVHRTLADPPVSGPARLDAALRLVPVVAASLSRAQASTVWRFCLVRASQPTDPYNPTPLTQQSREAAVELLIQRSELDSEIAAALPTPVGPRLPVAAELLAAALRRRPPDGGRALTEIVLAWRPTLAAALAFAAAADGTVAQIAAPEVAPSSVAAAGRRAYRMARTATALLVGPVVAAGVGWYTQTHHWGAAPASPGLADAVAALAVVATINVFTVQLSAQRLPGPIARVAGRPGWLVAAYSVAVTMAALAAFPGRQALLATAVGWARVVLLATFLVTLVGAMYVIVRRTDPGRAAGAFADTTFAAYRAAGRRLGRIQAKAAVVRALLGDLVGFEQGIEPELVGVRTRVFARRRGLLLPSPRRLRRLAAVSEVADGNVRIRISPGIGTTVTRGEQIAAVLPASFATVPRRLPRRVSRVLRIRRMRRLDDVATSAVALVAMAVDLAGSGDVGSAETVAEVAAELVSEHVVAARTARRRRLRRDASRATRLERRHPAHVLRAGVGSAGAAARARDTERAPIVPALRDTVKATVRARLRGDRDLADVPEMILQALLRHSELAEWAAVVAVTEVPDDWEQVGAHPSAVIQVLTMSGVRALESRDHQTIALVRDRLQRLSDQHAEWVVGGASVLTALTCWLAPSIAGEMLTWYEKLAEGVKTELRLDLCRVGAGALVAGVPSVAVRAADGLLRTSPDLHLLRRLVLGDVVRGREEAHSNLRGGYLGASPADALADFLTLMERLQGALSQP